MLDHLWSKKIHILIRRAVVYFQSNKYVIIIVVLFIIISISVNNSGLIRSRENSFNSGKCYACGQSFPNTTSQSSILSQSQPIIGSGGSSSALLQQQQQPINNSLAAITYGVNNSATQNVNSSTPNVSTKWFGNELNKIRISRIIAQKFSRGSLIK